MLFVVVKQGYDVALYFFAVYRKRNLFTAFIDILDMQFIATVHAGGLCALPRIGERGANMQTVVASLQAQNTLVVAH